MWPRKGGLHDQRLRQTRGFRRSAEGGDYTQVSIENKPLRAARSPLPTRLAEAHAGRNRHVQALHAAEHGNAYKRIAVLAREPAHALALRAEHPRERAVEPSAVKVFVGALVGADEPHAAI